MVLAYIISTSLRFCTAKNGRVTPNSIRKMFITHWTLTTTILNSICLYFKLTCCGTSNPCQLTCSLTCSWKMEKISEDYL